MRGFEILERAREAKAKLLSVDRLPAVGGDEQLAAALLIVFDAGRILVAAEASTGALCALHIESAEDAPSGMSSSLEEEPWWRVLGCALAGAAVEADGAILRLELQAEGAAPRVVTIAVEGDAVRSHIASAAH